MGLLDGKRLLVTGVITDASLAFHAANAFGQIAVHGPLAGLLFQPHRGPVHVR